MESTQLTGLVDSEFIEETLGTLISKCKLKDVDGVEEPVSLFC